MPGSSTLLVVAKEPAPGQTKTRLCPPLTPEQAASLYACFLRDTLDVMRAVEDIERVVCCLTEDSRSYFRGIAPDMQLRLQHGEALGERLDHLLTESLAGGSERAVVMDSDSPTLPPEYVARAFDLLDEADVVLGPTHDGGYYLIGMKQPQPHLLREVQMSTPDVLDETLKRARALRLAVRQLPRWYDIDTGDDLHLLEQELLGQSHNGNARATREWLLKHRRLRHPA
jgi:uncharacterized protein